MRIQQRPSSIRHSSLLIPALLMATPTPFTPTEIESAVTSLKSVSGGAPVDWSKLQVLLADCAHLPHKEWARTESSAASLATIIAGPDDPAFRLMFQRVLADGNWDAAVAAASARQTASKPWAVLVTGVNGIRKTSSVYQPWFQDALATALGDTFHGETNELPGGSNSFFRQLDYMIATVALQEFKALYEVEDVVEYAKRKDAIFSRYRTYAEMLGALLVKDAQRRHLNVMVETSGRDIAMFRYIDHFFPNDVYNKLVVHFTINEIGFAERSVDTRMLKEMAEGRAALATGDPLQIIQANAGGPYGSAALCGVQADSDKVWEAVKAGGDAGASWYKASIAISASEADPWVVRPIGQDGTHGSAYTFGPCAT